jgi:glycosyltransferase involved in cell wall biosynthesis
MKVLLTTHVFLPDYSSGTEILTLDTARELQRLGHEVEICTGFPSSPGLSDSERFDSYVYEGIRVHRFLHDVGPMGGQSNVVETEYNNLLFASWFRNYLRHFAPDIVHFFHLKFLSASGIDVCHELGIPMAMTPTDFWLICPNNQLRLPDNSPCKGPDANGVNCLKHAVFNSQSIGVARIFNRLPTKAVAAMIWGANHNLLSSSRFSPLVRALYRRPGFLRERMNKLGKVIVPTRLMQEMLVSNGLKPEKVVFSRFGIRPARQEPHAPAAEGLLRIGFIGGLAEHKGAHLLIQAVRLLPSTVPIELKIYGRSDLNSSYFDQLVRTADSDQRIRFCGTFPNGEIGNIFSNLDVLVVPSIWYENTPLVIYSAQAAGRPVIASNLGGMAEVVEHEKNGLLFEAGNVEALAAAIGRLVRDRILLESLAANSASPKTIAGYVGELVIHYNELLKDTRSKE